MIFFKGGYARRAAVLVISITMLLAPLMIVPSSVEANPGETDWMIVIVDSGGVGGWPSSAVDINDRLHISYYDMTNGNLKYATNAGGSWTLQTVDSSGDVGYWTSLAVDSNNKVHISYYDATNGDLKYATNAGGGWNCQTIDSAGSVGMATSLAIDSNNKVHISYYDWTNQDLKYITNSAGIWSQMTVDSANFVGALSSLAVDSNNKVHISYWYETEHDLRYATNAGGSWSCQTIDSAGLVGEDSSIAIDSEDKVHISYYDATNGDLKYITNSAGSWHFFTIDSMDMVGTWTSLAIDSSDGVHISYIDNTNVALKYATNSGGSWQTDLVHDNDVVYNSVKIDSHDRVYISFFDWGNSELKYATKKPGNVEIHALEEPNEVDEANSLALDSNGVCHISYFDNTNGYLKYATNPGGIWSNETVDSEGHFGYYTSLAIDSDDNVHISYYDITNNGLKYATNIGRTWTCTLIDSGDQVGYYNSMAIDSNDKVHISYLDITNCDLKYATNAGGSWICQTIDSSPDDVGYLTSIAVDSHNKAHITYFNQTYWCVMYATNAGGSWICQTVPGQIDGDYSSIAVDSNDKVHICFHDYSGNDLKYATCDSGIWTIQRVNGKNAVGFMCSLALDSEGNVHIAYHTQAMGDPTEELKYATNTNGVWSSMTLDSHDIAVAWWPSIAIDSDNRVHIVYYDVIDLELKYLLMYLRPSTPLDFSASEGDSYVQLNWLAPTIDVGYPVEGYALYRGIQEDEMSQFGWTTSTTFNDTSVTNGQTYYYKVKAFNQFGQGASTDVLMVVPGTVPSQPVSLQAEAGDSQVFLTWDPPLDDGGAPIDGYNIYRGVEETSLGFLEMSTKTDFLDSSVLNGQQYYYQVTAFNEHGEGPASGIVTATPGTTPSPPLALAAVAGDSFVQLNWTAPSDDGGFPVEGYNVYRGPDELSLVYIATVGESNFNDTTVTNGITYHYLVKAFNSLGEGDPSDITSAMPATVPSAPMGLQAECGDSYVLLSWLDPEDDGGMEVDGFNLYRGESEQTLSFLTVVYGIQFNDTSVTNGQVYYYRVTGFNAMGEGPMSNMVDALPQVGVVQTIPSAPLDLEVSGGDGCTRLHWHPPEDNGGSIITDYAIYRGTMSGSPSLLTTIGKFLDYKDNSVTNGITYYYQVSAINAIGEGPLSNEASATPNAFTAPSVPGDLMATPGDTRIMLSWSPPEEDGGSEILNYAIYRGTTSESETLLLVIGNVLYYTDTGLTNGLTYYYKVSAINAIGEGPLSSEVNATPFAPTTPSRPLSPQAQAGDSYVLVTWMVPSDDGGSSISGYNIYRGTSSTSLQLLADLGIVQEYNDTSVTNGVTYYYEVAAVNDLGEGQLSDMVNATPQATTVPTVPSAPQDPQCSSGDGYVMIAWDVPADDGGCEITCYNVYRGNDSDNLTLLATVPHPGTSYNDTSVENGHTYYYTITAVNDEGESPQSTTIVDTPDDGGDGEPSDSTIVIVIGVLLAVGVIAVLVFILRK